MSLPFLKMHAQGNDFVFLDFREKGHDEKLAFRWATALCDRHFGIGADGLALLEKPRLGGDVRLTIYNSDGSPAEICGSALRCLLGLLGRDGDRREFVIETLRGMHRGTIEVPGLHPVTRVDLGIPTSLGTVSAGGLSGERVELENPHLVIFTTGSVREEALRHGPALETSIPGGVNVHFARVQNPRELDLATWERGAGATLACGTGAGSTVWTGHRRGLLAERVAVHQPGGTVTVEITAEGRVSLEGEVNFVFSGEWERLPA
jgi:diaminopimelate epimerase